MTLFEQWELINYIANTDYEGLVISPDRFGQLVKIVNLDLFKIKMGLPEDYQPGVPISRQYPDLNLILTSETLFLVSFTPNESVIYKVSYPSNYFRYDTIRYNYQRNIDGVATVIPRVVEILSEQKYSDRAGNFTKKPTHKDPVGVLRSDGIYIYPENINEVDFSYIRYPVEPNFVYVQETGYITEGASTEYEWGEELHMDLTRMILGYVGINLRAEQVQQYAEQHKLQGT